jgi:hypothetical protein
MINAPLKAILTLATLSLSANAATVTSTQLQKAPFDTKKPLYIDNDGGHACPDGYDLYVRAIRTTPKDSKDKTPPQGDFDSFYFARSANPTSPAIIVSRPGIQEYVPACLQVK